MCFFLEKSPHKTHKSEKGEAKSTTRNRNGRLLKKRQTLQSYQGRKNEGKWHICSTVVQGGNTIHITYIHS